MCGMAKWEDMRWSATETRDSKIGRKQVGVATYVSDETTEGINHQPPSITSAASCNRISRPRAFTMANQSQFSRELGAAIEQAPTPDSQCSMELSAAMEQSLFPDDSGEHPPARSSPFKRILDPWEPAEFAQIQADADGEGFLVFLGSPVQLSCFSLCVSLISWFS